MWSLFPLRMESLGRGLRLQQTGLSQTCGEKLPDPIDYITRGKDDHRTLWNCHPTNTL